MTETADWTKAKKSMAGDACVELARAGEAVLVRNSKAPDGLVMSVEHARMIEFVDGVRSGDFDELLEP